MFLIYDSYARNRIKSVIDLFRHWFAIQDDTNRPAGIAFIAGGFLECVENKADWMSSVTSKDSTCIAVSRHSDLKL